MRHRLAIMKRLRLLRHITTIIDTTIITIATWRRHRPRIMPGRCRVGLARHLVSRRVKLRAF